MYDEWIQLGKKWRKKKEKKWLKVGKNWQKNGENLAKK